jgi:hypothetical protein
MKKLLGCFLLCTLAASWARAQATAQIHGTVQDMSGAAVSGATVKATQTETGFNRTTKSEAAGDFVMPNLPLGPYQLEISKEGFTTSIQTGVLLQVGSDPAVAVSLKVGAVSERINVEANATQVETRAVGVGTVIETQRILDLPLNGRQPTDLITLSGLAVQTGTSPGYNMSTGVNISIAGSTSHSIQYNLDGASHLDTYDGTNMPLPFPDALQEFKLVTSTQDASGGGHSGASVNSVTKSGTNAIHGDMFEFFRNSAMNGRDFFAARSDQLKRNQFGGVIGGPIKKDKIFFFVGYQGTITRQTPSDTPAFVPTAKMLTGDFSDYISNNCGPVDLGAFDSTNHLKSPVSSVALNISKFLPKSTNPCGRVSTGNPLSENRYQIPVRLDYQISDKQTLFARYLATKIDAKIPFELAPNDILTTTGAGADDLGQSLALGHTYVINPTMVNSFRVFVNRVGSNKPAAQWFSPADVGIQNMFSYLPKFTGMIVAGAFNLGVPANFTTSTTGYTNFGFNDDVNIIRGAHQISLGGSAMRAILVGNSYAWAAGVFTIVGLPAVAGGTGSAIGDFLIGKALNIHQANPNPNYTTQNFYSLYVNDTWKMSQKFTVNYGLRWNPFFPMQFTQSDVSNFDLKNFYAGIRSTVIPSAPAGFTFPGDAGFNGRSGLDHKYGNFEPRIGFAWDPRGDGKMAIRGGAGIAYDFIRQDLHQNTSSAAPFRLSIVTPPTRLEDPYAVIGGNPFPYSYNPSSPTFPTSPAFQGFYLIPSNLRTTQQYSWNLGIQRQFTSSLFASATYVGTQLIHTWNSIDLNPAQFISGNCVAGQYGLATPGPCSNSNNVNNRRILQLTNPNASNVLGTMTQLDDGGTQRYNGLLLNATLRKGGINLAGNYTWSHCTGLAQVGISNLSSTYPHQAYQNNGAVNRALDMGDCYSGAIDIRHIGNVTLVANTPKLSGSMARRLISGWTFSTIYTVRSGNPLTVNVGSDRAMNGLYQGAGNYPVPQRPNQVLADTTAADRGQSCSPAPCVSWFNKAAFALPALGTYGNMGVANLRGPGFWEWDQTIARQFRITESQRVEFRFEAFNVTNSVRFYLASGTNSLNFSNGQFGRVVSAASTSGATAPTGNGGRILQLALKYIF